MAQKRRPANDKAFKKYKSTNARLNNKIRKIKKHCKKHPEDKQNAEALKRVEKGEISNKMPSKTKHPKGEPKVFRLATQFHIPAETAGEQIARLFNLEHKLEPRKKVKPKVIHKRKKRGTKS